LGAPERLIIPAIEIDARVKAVGLTAEGNMATPGNFTDVGWYKYGTVPGERGSAVIDGHVDNGLGMNGVFKPLTELQVGDDMYVLTDSGARLHFVISELATYDYHSVPSELVFNDMSGTRVKLITCSGSWLSSAKTYDKRLVVTADFRSAS
jgi:sortase (surface protein transpeptidase)